MAIKSAAVANGRAYIGDKVRLVGDAPDRIEIVAGFKPEKKNGLQLVTARSRHWLGIEAKYYEWVERGPNAPEEKPKRKKRFE